MFQNCYGRYAIAAVNVFTMEQVHGLFRAGSKANAPFIVQLTPVARNYAHPQMLMEMILACDKLYPNTVFAVHLDHGNHEHALDAIQSEHYQSVMIDHSHNTFAVNVEKTLKIVELAHSKNICVEAELGVLSGVEDGLEIDREKAKYTNPDEVCAFVEQTHCDSLAIAVGTSHGAYKFSCGEGIQFDILKEIQKKLPNFPIVLHGGSGVSKLEVEKINAKGGKLKSGFTGVAPEEIKKSIALGVCKINIATDLRILWTRVHRDFFHQHPELFDPILPGKIYMDAVEELMLNKFSLFGSINKNKEFIS